MKKINYSKYSILGSITKKKPTQFHAPKKKVAAKPKPKPAPKPVAKRETPKTTNRK